MSANYTLTDDEQLMLIAGLNELAAQAVETINDDRMSDLDTLCLKVREAHAIRLIGARGDS
jgi:hypothetical protein